MRELIIGELRQLRQGFPALNERFGETDIRVSFFDGYFESLRTYYCSWFLLDSVDLIEMYKSIYENQGVTRGNSLLQIQGHKNIYNSMLIINTWSNFELCITLLAAEVLSEEKLEELYSIDYRRIKDNLKDIELPIEIDNKLKKLNKLHLAHVSINYKYGKLLKIITNYPKNRNKKEDKKFLEFYGKLRNCIHSNYIFYGNNDFSYTFNDVVFTFRPGELLNINPQPVEIFFLMSKKLKDIFSIIIDNIEHDELIFDPTHNLVN